MLSTTCFSLECIIQEGIEPYQVSKSCLNIRRDHVQKSVRRERKGVYSQWVTMSHLWVCSDTFCTSNSSCWRWIIRRPSCFCAVQTASLVSTTSCFSLICLDSSTWAVAMRSSASINSAGLWSWTASLLRWTKRPGPVSKKRSISSNVLRAISVVNHLRY